MLTAVLKSKFIVSFIVIFGTLEFRIARRAVRLPQQNFLSCNNLLTLTFDYVNHAGGASCNRQALITSGAVSRYSNKPLQVTQVREYQVRAASLRVSCEDKYQLSLIDPCDKIVLWTQSLTIYAINYSGRASELGGIIDLVDRRRSSLSRSEHPTFSG